MEHFDTAWVSAPTTISVPLKLASVWLQTADGVVHELDVAIVILSPLLGYLFTESSMGLSKDSAIDLPREVDCRSLHSTAQYCSFHLGPAGINAEIEGGGRKKFDQNFIKLHQGGMSGLLQCACFFRIIPLVALLRGQEIVYRNVKSTKSRKLAVEEFKHKKGLLQKKTYFIVELDDPVRVLVQDTSANDQNKDHRSVESLLSFIDGCGEHEQATTGKKQSNDCGDHGKVTTGIKKNSKKKKGRKANSSCFPKNTTQCVESTDHILHLSSTQSEISGRSEVATDGDVDDDHYNSDPELRGRLDIEVEEFERRLNLSWDARKQEILGFGIPLVRVGATAV